MATDGSGNFYVADTNNHTIRKITPGGAVTTLAGLAESPGHADGVGSAARFNLPSGVATDSSGNVYVADSGNRTIRKITPAGGVTTLAGVWGGFGSADGIGSAARFSGPQDVATDSSGNVYVADSTNCTIRKITPAGEVTTLAGLAGRAGSIDGTGSAARFGYPHGVATDSTGNVYVADTGNDTIRKITPGGTVTTLAGPRIDKEWIIAGRFSFPLRVATDSSGNVYVADGPYNNAIRKITPAGVVTTLAGLPRAAGSLDGNPGSTDGTGSEARFRSPHGVATDRSGNVYVADAGNHKIRKITPGGMVTTLAGFAEDGGSTDTASAAQFSDPQGVAADSSGNIYVAESYNSTILKVTPAGVVTTLAGLAQSRGSADGTGSAARFYTPQGVATDSSGNVYVADTNNNVIRKITPMGAVTTLAGLAGSPGNTDGVGDVARFDYPQGVATDSEGNVYVADSSNHTIRKITPSGTVTTLAGLAGWFGSADGTGSAARFNSPHGVAVDSDGNVYVADMFNCTIRKITPSGAVSTLAGRVRDPGSAEGTGSAARLSFPSGVATDRDGNVYVASSSRYGYSGNPAHHTIRKITPAGTVTTLAGLTSSSGSADGTGSAARFHFPAGVATDSSGNVYVADSYNRRIRIGKTALADVATVDVSSGLSGSARHLDTAPQTATAWQWSVIRRPADSAAILSSATIRNPTFTPDVPGLFTFRLIATGAGAASITTVDLLVSQPGRGRAVRK